MSGLYSIDGVKGLRDCRVTELLRFADDSKSLTIERPSKSEDISAGDMKVALRCVVVGREDVYRWLHRICMAGEVVD